MSKAQHDLTTGSVTRQLVHYAIPIVTTSLLQAVYGLTDMLVVSHYVGAVGASATNVAGQVMRL